jgi:cytochrome c-type biogenesis protein CcmH
MQTFKSRIVLIVIYSVCLVAITSLLVLWLKTSSDNQLNSVEQKNPTSSQTLDVKSPSPAPAQNKQAASVENLLSQLEQRLEKQPDDMQGWLLLAKSYRYLQRDDEAETALNRAQALGYKGSLDTEQANLARKPDPLNQLSTPMPMSDFLQDYLVNNPTKNTPSTIAKQHSADQNKGTILLKVALSDTLAQTINPDTAVFIFVRPYIDQQVNVSGPPLAAVRKTARELPLYIALNDQMAMMPGRTISSATQVVVGARLAISGNPIKQAGDIEQLSQAISTAEQATVSLIISNELADKR